MKDENGNIIKRERDIIARWKHYFQNLINEENERLFPYIKTITSY
jgi:hypothetical protein